VLPDPFLVTKDPGDPTSNDLIPVLYVEWEAGDGWTAIGGLPVFAGAAPVGTQTGATTATVSVAEATGAGDPFTYTVEKAPGPGFSVWTAATIGSTAADTPSAGFVQFSLTGLTTATSYKFRIKATGTNGQQATSQQSNSVTTT